jgi:hypothetical protein
MTETILKCKIDVGVPVDSILTFLRAKHRTDLVGHRHSLIARTRWDKGRADPIKRMELVHHNTLKGISYWLKTIINLKFTTAERRH